MHKNYSGTVALPREFFVRERDQLYSNWRFAFFRELFQNSVDARSTSIRVTVTVTEQADHCVVTFDDDGCGMDYDTFETVYFQLGESTKGDDNGEYGRVGGFGRARILTHFSMPGYEIATGNLRVQGVGSEYRIESRDETITGCRMTINVDSSASDMMLQLRNYLACSQLACHVTVNDEQWTMWAMKRQHVSDLTHEGCKFASVYVADSGLVNRALIRVRGTTMFAEKIKVPKQVVIEIEPEFSRVVLTGNRDGFHEDYAAVIRAWFNSISANPTSALKRRRSPIIQTVPRRGSFVSVHSSLEEPITPDDIEGDVYLMSELDSEQTEKLFTQFDPKDKRSEFIYRCWVIACSEVIPHALRLERRAAMNWACGWFFSEEELAKFMLIGDVAVFGLNPLDRDGRARYPAKSDSIRQIIATAKHEVAHYFHLDHDENFTTLLTELDSVLTISADAVKNKATGQLSDAKLKLGPLHLASKAIKLLKVVQEKGELSRRECIRIIYDIERDEREEDLRKRGIVMDDLAAREALGLEAGSHHWSHPLFTKFKQSGYLATTGRSAPTSETGTAKSEVYRLTPLGQRVLVAATNTTQETVHE